MEPKKKFKNKKLFRKIVGIFWATLFLILSFVSINKLRNYWGIMAAFTCVAIATTSINIAFPPDEKKPL